MRGKHIEGRGSVDRAGSGRAGAGFTLIELMIVILIIGVVVAIVFPALSGARNAARKAATQALMTELATASSQFYLDHNRYPGYFSLTEMGSPENALRGFSAMENIVLDLAGGITDDAAAPGTIFEVGPTTTGMVRVDLGLIGATTGSNKAYFTPDNKNFQAQSVAGKQVSTVAGHIALPDVVDAWGSPLLAWVQDDPGAAEDPTFAATEFTPMTRARYYWASNAAFLNCTSLGKLNENQLATGPGAEGGFSLIGGGRNPTQLADTLAGVLGHPAYPDPSDTTKPKLGRAAMVFHSAGADGFYLGSEEAGGKRAGGATGVIKYNPPAPPAVAGAPIPRQPDPLDGFDDLLVNAGNNN